MKLRSLSQSIVFHSAGVLSTTASVSGVFGYLMVENNAVGNLLSIGGIMSVGGAVGLGLSIYFGWEVAFNHKGIAKRIAAGLIAVSAATLSGYTIYQNTAHPILEQEHTTMVEQTTRAVQQQDAATATLQQQQADLRQQIKDLRQQNTTDSDSIKVLQASDKKGADWQAVQLRKSIEARTTEIGTLSERVENYTQRLTTPAESKTETNNTPTTTTEKPVVSWAMLARASMYEVMTALFLLFGSWYKTARKEAENAQVVALHTVTRTAEETLQTLQATVDALTDAMTQADKTIHTLETGRNASELLLVKVTAQADDIHSKASEGAAIIQQQDRTSEQLQTEITAIQALLVSANETVEQLQQGVAPAKEAAAQLQKTIVSANGLIANANNLIAGAIDVAIKDGVSIAQSAISSVKPIVHCAINQVAPEINNGFVMTYEMALKQLERNQIMTTEVGNISVQSIMQATGLGRRNCEQLQQEAWEKGFLSRTSKGRSYVYSYSNSADEAPQLDLTNVVQLTARNA